MRSVWTPYPSTFEHEESTVVGDSSTVDLELGLYRQSEGRYVVELRFLRPDSDADIRISPDETGLALIDPQHLLAFTSNDQLYGHTLSKMLFSAPAISKGFSSARSVAQTLGVPLRLRVYIWPEDDALHAVRWESLRDPETDAPLCLGDGLIFSRYLTSIDWQPVRPQPRGDIRALVIIANPHIPGGSALPPIDVAGELARAKQALISIPTIAALASAGEATFKKIEKALRSGPDIVYLMAHGALVEKQAHLFLERPDGSLDLVPGADLVNAIQGIFQKPRLIALLSCQSAGDDTSRALSALGPQLAKVGAPAVLAMHGNISIASATEFLPTFFTTLCSDGRVDVALAAARTTVRRSSDWWRPVLFMRSRSGRIWAEVAAPAPEVLDATAVTAGLDTLARVVPLHAPGAAEELKQHAEVLHNLITTSRFDPTERTARELLAALDRICAAIYGEDIDFAEVARGRAPELAPPVAPFCGLAAFQSKDARFFFGRDHLVESLVGRLQKQPFLALLGASGSGKSSLALAGLVPRLTAAEPGLRVAVIRPGATPLEHWDAEVAPHADCPLLLVVDQFEEIFSLCTDEAPRRAFFARLLQRAEQRQVIVTMRADFWGEVAPYPELRAMMQACQELIAPLTAEELRRAMEQQAAAADLLLEPGLGQIVLDDMSSEPGAMPLLQHALLELWHRRYGRWLRVKTYENIGRVQQAIARSAEKLYDTLPPADQELTRHIFLRLTRVEHAGGRAEGPSRDTRRRLPIDDLLRPGDDPAAVRSLLNRLVAARLVVTSGTSDQGEQSAEVEVAHEALIRHWPLLQEWIKTSRDDLVLFESLRTASEAWQQENRAASMLVHRGERITQAEQLCARPDYRPTKTMQRYLEACRVAREREKELEAQQRLKRLEDVGWGVIFPAAREGAEDPYAAVREALRPLLELRKRQARGRYHEYLYRPGETKSQFLARFGMGSGPPNPDKVPYYLLIVGNPTEIPFLFQYQLDVQYGVGRISFNNLEAYNYYARSVVAAETRGLQLPRRVSIFGTNNHLDVATLMSHHHLTTPITEYITTNKPYWLVDAVLNKQATKSQLQNLINGPDTPALLFTASHGLGLPPSAGNEKERLQGSLITQDWPGSGKVTLEHCFTIHDISIDARILGTIMYFFADYSAGTPRYDNFNFNNSPKKRKVAHRDFIAAFPQGLLSHPLGGALAVIGRIDRVSPDAFSDRLQGIESVIGHLTGMLDRLLDGYPVGAAMELLNQRYGELAAEYVELLASEAVIDSHEPISRTADNERKLAPFRAAVLDARNYLVLGDPAVRLMVGESTDPVPRPTLEELERSVVSSS